MSTVGQIGSKTQGHVVALFERTFGYENRGELKLTSIPSQILMVFNP